MTLGKSLLLATLAASGVVLFRAGWLLMPRQWVIPVAYGLLVVVIWVEVFVVCFWFHTPRKHH